MRFFYNKAITINNPLRIFFLCGSRLLKNKLKVKINNDEYEIEDKRKVIQNFLDETYPSRNFRSVILEDNFMFGNKSPRHLNYNDINLKSLKSIELLTSLFSDNVFIVHESFSTAAEIGLFSASESINNKLVILTPNDLSVEEDYISGFMQLAYQKNRNTKHKIKIIYYNPGIYNFHVSDQVRKLHTFFINNEIKGTLKTQLTSHLDYLGTKKILFGRRQGLQNRFKNHYMLNESKIRVILDSNDFFSYLISLFNLSLFRDSFIQEVDMSHLRKNNEQNRRKSLFNEVAKRVETYFKEGIYNTIKTDIPNIESEFGPIEKIDSFIEITLDYQVVPIKDCISYYLYILYALAYISFADNNTRFKISRGFSPVYEEYKDLIQVVKSDKNMWCK
ncbi:hypothetical protein M3181_02725 [Mesobacillus maritimus]|uniref:hypothetical protein n=1 Tax=Mesobacillus maritimus TaxID=1643336 RepID=UPI002041A518|nr:hypothetical protein [Mesobacillus maritimus]MCM3667915.1 hypothetical protein [Mesobacillus maritimus]